MTTTLFRKISTAAATVALLASAHAASVSMEWKNPDKYSDLGTEFGDNVTIDQFSKEVEPYVQRMANQYLSDDANLMMTVTDVDLAGEYEPWRINADVRIVRSVYPPRMTFKYRLENGEGKVVKSGEASISDLDFDYNIGRRFFDSDQFFYEKEMIAEWIRNDLAKD